MRRPLATLVCLLALASACNGGSSAVGRCAATGEPRLVSEDRLVAAVDLAYPPFSLPGADGPAGFDVDLLREVAKRIGREARFVRQTFAGLVVGLRAQRFDVAASGLGLDPELEAQACATSPYLSAGLGIVAAGELAGLGDARVAVQADTTAAEWARDELASSRIQTHATVTDPFVALRDGHADAAVAALPVALHQVHKTEAFRLLEETGPATDYVFAVDEGNGALAGAIDQVLQVMREDGTYGRIYERWFGRLPPG